MSYAANGGVLQGGRRLTKGSGCPAFNDGHTAADQVMSRSTDERTVEQDGPAVMLRDVEGRKDIGVLQQPRVVENRFETAPKVGIGKVKRLQPNALLVRRIDSFIQRPKGAFRFSGEIFITGTLHSAAAKVTLLIEYSETTVNKQGDECQRTRRTFSSLSKN